MLLGKPLIAYTIEKALESRLCDRVVVSTDDPKIAKVAREYGSEVIDRPEELALDTSPIDDSLRHAVRHLKETEGFTTDIVVLLQANVPIRQEGEIDLVVEKITENRDVTSVATGYIIDQRPEWMKILDPETGMVKFFMGKTKYYRMQDLPELYLFDGANTTVRCKTLMETEGIKMAHAYMGDNVKIVVHDQKYAVEIDEEKDFDLAEFYLSNEGSG
jgi:CMP-N-acetylneuraminic acid synthetase